MKKKFYAVNDLKSGLDCVRSRKSPNGLVSLSTRELEKGLQRAFGEPILNERDEEKLREFAEREAQKKAKRDLKLNTFRLRALKMINKVKIMQRIRAELMNKGDIFRNIYEDSTQVMPARKLSAEKEEDLATGKDSAAQEYPGFTIRNLEI